MDVPPSATPCIPIRPTLPSALLSGLAILLLAAPSCLRDWCAAFAPHWERSSGELRMTTRLLLAVMSQRRRTAVSQTCFHVRRPSTSAMGHLPVRVGELALLGHAVSGCGSTPSC